MLMLRFSAGGELRDRHALPIETCFRCRLGIAAGASVAASVVGDERFRRGGGWEAELDYEAAAGSGLCDDGGVVGVGDRLHDREAEPDPVGRGACVRAESLEGLEEAGELAGRITGPVFAIVKMARPAAVHVATSSRPPGTL